MKLAGLAEPLMERTLMRYGLIAACIVLSGCGSRSLGEPTTLNRIAVQGKVIEYQVAAQWDHFDDGSFATFDSAKIQIQSPDHLAGRVLSVTVPPQEVSDDSPLRAVGNGVSFQAPLAAVRADQVFWGMIQELKLLE